MEREPMDAELWGRDLEAGRELARRIELGETGWMALRGLRGSGKSTLLAEALGGRPCVVLQAAPLGPQDLLEDLRQAIRMEFGELPRPLGPGVLPEPEGRVGWRTLLLGLVDRAASGGRAVRLVLDGWEELVGVHGQLPAQAAEAMDRARRRGAPFQLLVTLEATHPDQDELRALGDPLAVVELEALPLRAAARAQGGFEGRDAFLRWACLGGHRAHLPPGLPHDDWETAVVERVLKGRGDLHDRPLRWLRERFSRPERYGSLVRALSLGPMEWAPVLEAAAGIRQGGQMAPYLKRLEEEGIAISERPLDAPEGSRKRRYRLSDPFWAFWFSCVLPVRSALVARDPWNVWREGVRPRLEGHLERWLPMAAREWFRDHARERLPAPTRRLGGLWGGEADFDLVAWLTNGQVCYVDAVWKEGPVKDEALADLLGRMKRSRYGIGREARAPILVVSGPVEESLRRRVAAVPLATLITLDDLMGPSDGVPSQDGEPSV
jgi:hypothetical protein